MHQRDRTGVLHNNGQPRVGTLCGSNCPLVRSAVGLGWPTISTSNQLPLRTVYPTVDNGLTITYRTAYPLYCIFCRRYSLPLAYYAGEVLGKYLGAWPLIIWEATTSRTTVSNCPVLSNSCTVITLKIGGQGKIYGSLCPPGPNTEPALLVCTKWP